MNLIRIAAIFAISLCALSICSETRAASAQVEATLVLANSSGQGIDPALNKFASNLKKLFKHNSFKLEARSNTRVDLPGNALMSLGGGYQVALKTEPANDGRIRLSARWTKGSQKLVDTTMIVSKNRPTVLGGPRVNNGNLILILIVR